MEPGLVEIFLTVGYHPQVESDFRRIVFQPNGVLQGFICSIQLIQLNPEFSKFKEQLSLFTFRQLTLLSFLLQPQQEREPSPRSVCRGAPG